MRRKPIAVDSRPGSCLPHCLKDVVEHTDDLYRLISRLSDSYGDQGLSLETDREGSFGDDESDIGATGLRKIFPKQRTKKVVHHCYHILCNLMKFVKPIRTDDGEQIIPHIYLDEYHELQKRISNVLNRLLYSTYLIRSIANADEELDGKIDKQKDNVILEIYDVYKRVQFLGKAVPRTYLLSVAGKLLFHRFLESLATSSTMKHSKTEQNEDHPVTKDMKRAIETVEVIEMLKDILLMSRAVQHPVHGLFFRHYMLDSYNSLFLQYITYVNATQEGTDMDSEMVKMMDMILAFSFDNLEEMIRLWMKGYKTKVILLETDGNKEVRSSESPAEEGFEALKQGGEKGSIGEIENSETEKRSSFAGVEGFFSAQLSFLAVFVELRESNQHFTPGPLQQKAYRCEIVKKLFTILRTVSKHQLGPSAGRSRSPKPRVIAAIRKVTEQVVEQLILRFSIDFHRSTLPTFFNSLERFHSAAVGPDVKVLKLVTSYLQRLTGDEKSSSNSDAGCDDEISSDSLSLLWSDVLLGVKKLLLGRVEAQPAVAQKSSNDPAAAIVDASESLEVLTGLVGFLLKGDPGASQSGEGSGKRRMHLRIKQVYELCQDLLVAHFKAAAVINSNIEADAEEASDGITNTASRESRAHEEDVELWKDIDDLDLNSADGKEPRAASSEKPLFEIGAVEEAAVSAGGCLGLPSRLLLFQFLSQLVRSLQLELFETIHLDELRYLVCLLQKAENGNNRSSRDLVNELAVLISGKVESSVHRLRGSTQDKSLSRKGAVKLFKGSRFYPTLSVVEQAIDAGLLFLHPLQSQSDEVEDPSGAAEVPVFDFFLRLVDCFLLGLFTEQNNAGLQECNYVYQVIVLIKEKAFHYLKKHCSKAKSKVDDSLTSLVFAVMRKLIFEAIKGVSSCCASIPLDENHASGSKTEMLEVGSNFLTFQLDTLHQGAQLVDGMELEIVRLYSEAISSLKKQLHAAIAVDHPAIEEEVVLRQRSEFLQEVFNTAMTAISMKNQSLTPLDDSIGLVSNLDDATISLLFGSEFGPTQPALNQGQDEEDRDTKQQMNGTFWGVLCSCMLETTHEISNEESLVGVFSTLVKTVKQLEIDANTPGHDCGTKAVSKCLSLTSTEFERCRKVLLQLSAQFLRKRNRVSSLVLLSDVYVQKRKGVEDSHGDKEPLNSVSCLQQSLQITSTIKDMNDKTVCFVLVLRKYLEFYDRKLEAVDISLVHINSLLKVIQDHLSTAEREGSTIEEARSRFNEVVRMIETRKMMHKEYDDVVI